MSDDGKKDEPGSHDPKLEVAAVAAQPVGDGKTIHAKVYAPFKTYFDGPVESISAVNDTGAFDILPKHHNFMTLLNEGDIIVRTERGEERIPINRGVMHVKADQVVVFLDV